jgi:hypothetical protein
VHLFTRTLTRTPKLGKASLSTQAREKKGSTGESAAVGDQRAPPILTLSVCPWRFPQGPSFSWASGPWYVLMMMGPHLLGFAGIGVDANQGAWTLSRRKPSPGEHGVEGSPVLW